MPNKSVYDPGEEGVHFGADARPSSVVMCIMSSVSAMASCTIILAFSTVLRKKASSQGVMRIILFISVANLLTSLGSIVGEPRDRSAACWFEGIVTNVFTLSSVYWCLDVVVVLHSIVAGGSARKIEWIDHAVCWGIPIIVTLIPLSNSRYGSPGNIGWCFVAPLSDDGDTAGMQLTWFWVAFYGHLWLCISLILYLFQSIVRHINTSHATISREMLFRIYHRLRYYPLVVVVCWLPSCCVDTSSLFSPAFPGYDVVNGIAEFCGCAQGLLTTIVFWQTNQEARRATLDWYQHHLANALTTVKGATTLVMKPAAVKHNANATQDSRTVTTVTDDEDLPQKQSPPITPTAQVGGPTDDEKEDKDDDKDEDNEDDDDDEEKEWATFNAEATTRFSIVSRKGPAVLSLLASKVVGRVVAANSDDKVENHTLPQP